MIYAMGLHHEGHSSRDELLVIVSQIGIKVDDPSKEGWLSVSPS